MPSLRDTAPLIWSLLVAMAISLGVAGGLFAVYLRSLPTLDASRSIDPVW